MSVISKAEHNKKTTTTNKTRDFYRKVCSCWIGQN